MRRLLIAFVLSLLSVWSFAGTVINTTGSDDSLAISGFDAVAFFSQKKAVQGNPEWAFQYQGAKWLFSSSENLQLFSKTPENFLPEWGGQCAWCVSENCISNKKLSGSFDVIGGKLYLFAHGNESSDGARTSFWNSGGGAQSRIRAGNKNWVDIQKKLADDLLQQKNALNYRKTRFD